VFIRKPLVNSEVVLKLKKVQMLKLTATLTRRELRDNHSKMIEKLIFAFLLIMTAGLSFGQFSFKNDSTETRIQSGAMLEIDKKYTLQKDNDFELRLFIFPRWSDTKDGLSIFILSFKHDKWTARLFRNPWSAEKSQEVLLKSEGLDSLWKQLEQNNVLTIPHARDLVDNKGEMLFDQLQGDSNSILYSFELLSKTSVRHYAYKCPKEFSIRYNYIETFKNVLNIVQYILKYCKIEMMKC
jgi:hypothetical protein